MNQLKQIIVSLLLLLSFSELEAQIETYAQGELNFLKLTNGLNIIIKNNTPSPTIEVSFHIRFGSIYEQDSFSGISNVLEHIMSNKIQRHLSNSRNILNNKSCSFNSFVTTEQSVFKFRVSSSYVKNCFDLMVDSVYNSVIRDLELRYAIESIQEELSQASSVRQRMDSTMLRKLYRVEFDRLNVTGNPAKFKNFNQASLQKHKARYYKSDNTICSVNGSFQTQSIINDFTPSASRLLKGITTRKALQRLLISSQ
ncbi:MAG: insulinase family protein [Bacteroidetes bacterium]|nr:insulinase family protein [Bacteroidota bacterium]